MLKRSFILYFVLLFAFSAYLIASALLPGQRVKQLILAHNLNEVHPIHKGVIHFSEKLRELSSGRIQVKLYPNAQLGNEREVIELLQIGAVSLTKVSSLSLEAFEPLYATINLPYIFRDRAHYFSVLDGSIGREILLASMNKKFIGLTFFDAGVRSFYAHKPILSPSDMKGLKMRVLTSKSAIEMVKALGGSPVPTPYSEVYTALQQKVIDAAENNPLALTVNRHGEVAKHYSLNEHAMQPDVFIMSAKLWRSFSNKEREWVQEAARSASLYQRDLWLKGEVEAMRIAQEELGVKVYRPNKEPFIKLVTPLHEVVAARGERFKEIIDGIKADSGSN